jgi:xeroderma pigmentosum group C-complementing protein
VAGRDEVEGPEEEAAEAPQGVAAVKGAGGGDEGAAAYQQAQAQQDWSDEEQWEDAWGEEGGEEEEEEEEEGDAAAGDRTEGNTEGLTICLDSEHGQAKPSRRPTQPGGPRRLGVTKVDRLRAQLLHRTHLLCLLARGRQLDAAAGDPLLQAQLVSLLEPGPEAKLYEGEVLSTAAVSLRGVRQQLSWLHRTFKLRPLPGGGGEDPVAAAFLQATGLPRAVQQLREAVEQRRCGGEQLVAVFAALLRAQGASVRLVCALHASPLRPTGECGAVRCDD